jgi:hypothetical protein
MNIMNINHNIYDIMIIIKIFSIVFTKLPKNKLPKKISVTIIIL